MWTRLNIWIMAPGDAARVDDRDGWVVYARDARQQPFEWKGFDYSKGTKTAAPGWLEYELPPGTFVVWAEREDGDPPRTHKAVVAVHAESVIVVRLVPDAIPDGEPEKPGRPTDKEPERPRRPTDKETPDRRCELSLDELNGYMAGRDLPRKLELLGHATGCSEVKVVVRRPQGGPDIDGTAPVAADGSWRFEFENRADLRCGETLLVDVTCISGETCRRREEMTIRCREEPG